MSDGFKLGRDPEAKDYEIGVDSAAPGTSDETTVQVQGGCVKCHRQWPEVTFKKVAEALAAGEKDVAPVCDRCWDADPDLEKAIEEATGVQTVPSLIRFVEVTGIESKTNVVSFKYATHIGGKELVTTLLNVAFKGKTPGEFVWYVYRNVPVAVCEAWFVAPMNGQSHGSFFAEQIRKSYDSERKV